MIIESRTEDGSGNAVESLRLFDDGTADDGTGPRPQTKLEQEMWSIGQPTLADRTGIPADDPDETTARTRILEDEIAVLRATVALLTAASALTPAQLAKATADGRAVAVTERAAGVDGLVAKVQATRPTLR